MLNFILWDLSPQIFTIAGRELRWYGLLFASGFLIGQYILVKIYKGEGKSEKYVDSLTIYMLIATIAGARLGHCFFYEPEYFLEHPLEVFAVWQGGLASHGATVGILLGIFLYSRKHKDQSYLYVLDRIVITIALAGCLIRLGNLMNSEIIGKPTNISTAFLFVNEGKSYLMEKQEDIKSIKVSTNGKDSIVSNDITYAGTTWEIEFKQGKTKEEMSNIITSALPKILYYNENIFVPEHLSYSFTDANVATVNLFAIPRHPSQLYEAISSFILFWLLLFIYGRTKAQTPEGRIFGLFCAILFSLRITYEFFKENQVAFESGMQQTLGLNMGQILSIPMVIIGLIVLVRSFMIKQEM